MAEIYIRDVIFPLIKGKRNNGMFTYGELIGTGFLIGNNGYALTAAHVIEQLLQDNADDDIIVGNFVEGTKWISIEIETCERHPSEDVGLVRLKGFSRKSFLQLDITPQHASCPYTCWGYPHEVAKELSKLYEDALDRPDLIFTKGYVRRRITGELYPTIIFRGTQFYELSETVGGGNSGGPLILERSIGQQSWKVFGIYIGEKANGSISYGVRAEAFGEWKPLILGKTILEESTL